MLSGHALGTWAARRRSGTDFALLRRASATCITFALLAVFAAERRGRDLRHGRGPGRARRRGCGRDRMPRPAARRCRSRPPSRPSWINATGPSCRGCSSVGVGTRVEFPNNDSVSHQVYSFSPAKRFQLPLYKGEIHPPVTFDQPGLVVLGCNIHDSMVGYIYVTDAPYFGTTERVRHLEAEGLAHGRLSDRGVESLHRGSACLALPLGAHGGGRRGQRANPAHPAAARPPGAETAAARLGLLMRADAALARSSRSRALAPLARAHRIGSSVDGDVDLRWVHATGETSYLERGPRVAALRSRSRRRRAGAGISRAELARDGCRLRARGVRRLRRSQSKSRGRERVLSGRAAVSDRRDPLARARRRILHAGIAGEPRHRLDRRLLDHAIRHEYLAWRGVPHHWAPRWRRAGSARAAAISAMCRLVAAAYGWNDPAGVLICLRGFALTDRPSTLFGSLGSPPIDFYHEIDHRPGLLRRPDLAPSRSAGDSRAALRQPRRPGGAERGGTLCLANSIHEPRRAPRAGRALDLHRAIPGRGHGGGRELR